VCACWGGGAANLTNEHWYQGWQSHRTFFFPKKSHRSPQKNLMCYSISKLNINNLRLLRLFRFFNKLSTVIYLVVSCDCFVIIMFPKKEKFEFDYDLLRHSAFFA